MKPLLKWAGGKRQILDKLKNYMPDTYNNYYEPFVGAGALLLSLDIKAPKKVYINDINEDLYAIYSTLGNLDSLNELITLLDDYQEKHNEDFYYKMRSLDRSPRWEITPHYKKAARAIYLNKACYNGLYRVNSKGYFNTPSGKKLEVKLYDKENLYSIYNFISGGSVILSHDDFEDAVRSAKSGDFVYFDPPYDNYVNKRNFTSYSKFDFTKEDQTRLANLFKYLTKKGVKCMLSNHNTEFIRELYKDYNINVISARRSINCNGNDRKHVEEVIITNY